MSKRELKKQQKRAKKYGCDGRCYWETGMCPAVEVCEETRAGEFMATVIGGIVVLLMMAIPPILLAGGRHDSADLGDHSDSSRDLEGGK